MDLQEIELEPDDSSHENIEQTSVNEHDEAVTIPEVIDLDACLTSLSALKSTTSSDLPIDIDQIEPFMLKTPTQQYNIYHHRFLPGQNRFLSNNQQTGGNEPINLDDETQLIRAENPNFNYHCPICLRPLVRKPNNNFSDSDDKDNEQDDDFNNNYLTKWSATKCGHIFCHKCIKVSLKQKKSCPVCRSTLNAPRDIIRIYF